MQTIINSFVQLPDYQIVAISGFIISAVALAVNFAVLQFSWLSWLKKYEQEWGIAAAAAVIAYVQNKTPDLYADLVVNGIAFLLSAIAVYMAGRKALKF